MHFMTRMFPLALCGAKEAVVGGADECLDKSVSGIVEELRRVAGNERNENSDLCHSVNSAPTGLTANRFYSRSNILRLEYCTV